MIEAPTPLDTRCFLPKWLNYTAPGATNRNISALPYIRKNRRSRLAGVAEPAPTTPAKREDLIGKLDELRAQSRRYVAELTRITDEVERLHERLADLGPEGLARRANAAAGPIKQHGAA